MVLLTQGHVLLNKPVAYSKISVQVTSKIKYNMTIEQSFLLFVGWLSQSYRCVFNFLVYIWYII